VRAGNRGLGPGGPPRPGNPPRTRWERGAGTVLVVGAVGAVVVLLVGALVVAAAVRDLHRARSAADLAALAAAVPVASAGSPDCGAAARVAAVQGARLLTCRSLPDGTVLVDVTVRWPVPAGWADLPANAIGRARAGPVAAEPGR
jgi:secretion/DNA translocation related TadE-like protein